MNRSVTILLLLALTVQWPSLSAQSSLTIDQIMQGDRFTGILPGMPGWSPLKNTLYFSWGGGTDSVPSLWALDEGSVTPRRVSVEEERELVPSGTFNRNRSLFVYSKDGDLFLTEVKSGRTREIISTSAQEGAPRFSLNEDKILFSSGNNLFAWDITTGHLTQLTDVRRGKEVSDGAPALTGQERWLQASQLSLYSTLAERRERRERDLAEAAAREPQRLRPVYTGLENLSSVRFSPDGNYITWLSSAPPAGQRTIIPGYVTESGFTESIGSRTKVGIPMAASSLFICDLSRDTIYQAAADLFAGEGGELSFRHPVWSDDGRRAVAELFSTDNKRRLITLLDLSDGSLRLLDEQRDSAWIGGPGIGYGMTGWLPDNRTIYYQSEESGFSHIYLCDVVTGEKRAITSGSFEVYSPRLSNDRKQWYFISNEGDHGVRELYRMPVRGGTPVKLTNFGGGVEYHLSADESYIALRVSWANKPWELYLMRNRPGASPQKITVSTTAEFRDYEWRLPEFIRFRASDGVMVPARLYRPADGVSNGAAVIFVHGAGYLQNAHRWWSSYSREYMFHNFLVDNGYTVLDIDYRGSAGYGRDWRSAIYRHMGGRDLDDHVDGAAYLVAEHGIDHKKVGIYGGSYGGFITLMGLFTRPEVFAAGAALRPVTDWAHYSHGYTSNILNTPMSDSLAYVRSSPVYHAGGLQGALLICHGMIDDNVHFQDVVMLTQRLIELGKDNWELAVYPLESHGFIEPSSWTDEYKRIYRLFRDNLE